MDIQARKIHFIQEFLRTDDEELLTKLENLLRKESKKKYDKENHPMTVNEFNKMVDQSEDDFRQGKAREAKDLV